jgi:hypothetical protein
MMFLVLYLMLVLFMLGIQGQMYTQLDADTFLTWTDGVLTIAFT